MVNIKSWMNAVRLKMNPAKTEFIYFRNKPQLKKCIIEDLNVARGLNSKIPLHKVPGSTHG